MIFRYMFLCQRRCYLQKISLRLQIYETYYEGESLCVFKNLHVSVFAEHQFIVGINDEVISGRIKLINRPINMTA